jgi:hypothetical protein
MTPNDRQRAEIDALLSRAVHSPEVAVREELCALIEERLFTAERWIDHETHTIRRKLFELGLWKTEITEYNVEGGIVRESALGIAVNVLVAAAYLGMMQDHFDTAHVFENAGFIGAEEREKIDTEFLRAEDGEETVMRPFVQKVWREHGLPNHFA